MNIIKTLVVLVILYAIFLFSGYGVTVGSSKNAAGLGLKCQYLTARGIVSAQYIHSDNGIIGVATCPLLKKVADVIDQ